MERVDLVLARRYAQAFCHVHGSALTREDFCKLMVLREVLLRRRHIFCARKMLESLVSHCSAARELRDIIALLGQHKRVALFPEVIREIANCYAVQEGIEFVQIISSHQLSAAQKAAAVAFAQRAMDAEIVYECHVDPRLIAGLRLQSSRFVWEHSIKQRLDAVQRQLCP